jgi:predicted HicB family RNase H-like nuclease
MQTISYRRYTAYIEKDGDIYCGQVMTDGGVINFEGYSWEEVEAEFHAAIDDYLTTVGTV